VGSVWAYSEAGVAARISPGANRVTAVVPLPGARPGGPAGRGFLFGGPTTFAGGAVWIANPAGLYRVDPATNRARRLPIRPKPLTEYGHISLASGDGRVWMRAGDRRVVVIDPRTAREVAARPACGGGGNIAFGFGSLWVANAAEDTVWRIGG
jgi:DNA-binding beta-propeller fold protein YncE